MATIPLVERPIHLLNRVAFGPAAGELETVKRIGTQRWLEQQLHPDDLPQPPELAGQLEQLETLRMTPIELFEKYGPPIRPGAIRNPAAQQEAQRAARRILEQAMSARLYRAIMETRQLQEVMAAFWFNHFNVFAGKGLCHLWVGSYEESAIRPHALGRFRDLLDATARHPAMLFYLDNWQNTAPDSPGRRGKFEGINENYARELMELHTLGVDGGYTQQDVIALAHLLTGWSIVRRENPINGGFWRRMRIQAAGAAIRTREGFLFDPSRHDFASQRLLGHSIAGGGIDQGERALDLLARSPATARHLSYQIAQYFVADNPPPALVSRMAERFLASGGEIRATLETMFASAEFWDTRYYGAKFKTPYEFVISAVRATGIPVRNVLPLTNTMAGLGMPLYGCQTPDGYKNTREAWLNPEAMMVRLSFATALGAGRLPLNRPISDFGGENPAPVRDAALGDSTRVARADQNPRQLGSLVAPPVAPDPAKLAITLGGRFSARTAEAVESAPEQLRAPLILGSPEFMMR